MPYLAISWLLARPLNLLARGEMQARTLGVAVAPLRTTLYILAALSTASAVTLAGSVGFVGLVVPHLLRLAGARDQRVLLPACVLAGGTLLVIANTLSRTLWAPQQLPVGILTAAIGIPLFLLLLLTQRRGHSHMSVLALDKVKPAHRHRGCVSHSMSFSTPANAG